MGIEIICGQLGFPPDTFWSMTPRETQLAIRGYSKRREQDYRMQMEAGRIAGYMAMLPYMKSTQSITSILRFPWEEGTTSGNRVTHATDTLQLSEDTRKLKGSYSIPKDPARPARINTDPKVIEEYLARKKARERR